MGEAAYFSSRSLAEPALLERVGANAGDHADLLPRPSAEEALALARRLERPLGLLGASIGLKLGLDFVCEEKDAAGHYVMEWEERMVALPFL